MAELQYFGEPIFIDLNKTPDHFIESPTVITPLTTDVGVQEHQQLASIEKYDEQIPTRAKEKKAEEAKKTEKTYLKIEQRRIRCPECQRYTAENEEKMLRHIRKVHKGENPFQCYMCDYSTYNKVLFEEHVRIHQGIKPYKCSYCPYRSVSKKNTKKHERIHQPDYPLRCKTCEFIARNPRALTKHLEIHNGGTIKWYKCNVCRFRTHVPSKLKSHKKIHESRCRKCDFVAQSNALLKRHMETDHNVEFPEKKKSEGKSFKCANCQWTSKCKSRILLHLIHHPHQAVDESFIDVSILRKYGIMKLDSETEKT